MAEAIGILSEVLQSLQSLQSLQRSMIRFVDTGTKEFQSRLVIEFEHIEYATLSHTWGRREVTYEDWCNAQARDSDDGKKVQDACQVVRESTGLQRLWVDTCCINKNDKAEVSAAIYYMFSLYQNSKVCLAYLSDVPTANTNNHKLLSSQVRKSRWFKRGWTLLELLAPPQLIFYAADWTVLGRRDDSLAELISEITGIDQAYLSGRKNVQQASVNERMSWMSNRKTTRVEDRAYCMLGILGIDMEIRYGEGRRAMRRLRKEIEQSMGARMNSLSPSTSHQADLRQLYTGGEEEPSDSNSMLKSTEHYDTKSEDVQVRLASSKDFIHICILDLDQDTDRNTRNTLKRLLERVFTGYVMEFTSRKVRIERSTVDIVFCRSKTPQAINTHEGMASMGYGHGGTLKATRLETQDPPSSSPLENLDQAVPNLKDRSWEFDIFCKRGKREVLEQLELGLAKRHEQFLKEKLMVDFNLLSSPNPRRSLEWPRGREQGRSLLGSLEMDLPIRAEYYPRYMPPADRHVTENNSQYAGHSDESPPDSIFNFSIQSAETRPSTVPTSVPSAPPRASGIAQRTDLSTGEKHGSPLRCIDKSEDQSILERQHTEEHEGSDTTTIYSIETLADDPKLHYFQVFVDQLAEDVRTGANGMVLRDLAPDYLDYALKEFAWKLHEESSNPFQLETSVIVHRKRRNIVDLLDFEVPQLEIPLSESEESSSISDTGGDGVLAKAPFEKAEETIVAWIVDVNPDPGSTTDLSQMPQYRQFIQESSAYRWLLTKLEQHDRLTCQEPNFMSEIGVAIRDKLKTTESLRKMSRNNVPVRIEMTYNVNWDLVGFMRTRGIPSPFSAALPNILCLTGAWDEAQATTVIEYMDQTWPQTGRALVALLQTLLSALEEDVNGGTSAGSPHTFSLGNLEVNFNHQSIIVTVIGGQYSVSEVGEQIAWLASALQAAPGDLKGFVMSSPRILDLVIHNPSHKGKKVAKVRASCAFQIDWSQTTGEDVTAGLCWKQLFNFPTLVRGYPVLQRSVPKSGLEIPLALAASIMGSNQVVHLDDRLFVKGFNMLMVATLVAADIMVWHLFVSEKPEQRISYMDSRIDGIGTRTSDADSLHFIESKRHVVGWCTKATDWCGNPNANQNIRPAGLPRSPASLRIDKLYIEGGATVIGGLMMDINKKEQPFWLQREKDYPDLLNWVKLRPIVFYDVEERRAWLVDGASALLHLVRISLHQDTNDAESAYDWVYDPTKLKDKWPGVGGRQAAVNTLKNWDNRALGLHIIGKRPDANGVLIPEYSTFEDRVKRILHSIEILVDQQEKAASQDGFKVSQTWDPRRDIIGYEVMDIIGPSGPIYSRAQRINSWGHGWTDLVPSIGLTTIFGRGFGDLIRADDPGELCPNWRLVPFGKNFLAASVSTIQMLYEKRLLKLEPGRSEDEIAKRVTIVAAKEASNPCKCLQQQGSNNNHLLVTDCHHKPVQFLTKRWWLLGALPNGLVPVRLGSLPVRGAVILGHTVLGIGSKDTPASRQRDDDGAGSTTTGESLQATWSSSNVTELTTITATSVGSSNQEESGGRQRFSILGNRKDGTRKKRWSKFKDWVKK